MKLKHIIPIVVSILTITGIYLYNKNKRKTSYNWNYDISNGWLTWEESIEPNYDCKHIKEFDEYGNAYFEPVCSIRNNEICHRQCI